MRRPRASTTGLRGQRPQPPQPPDGTRWLQEPGDGVPGAKTLQKPSTGGPTSRRGMRAGSPRHPPGLPGHRLLWPPLGAAGQCWKSNDSGLNDSSLSAKNEAQLLPWSHCLSLDQIHAAGKAAMPDARCWERGRPDGPGSSPSSLWPGSQDRAQGAELTPQPPLNVASRPLPRWWGPRRTPRKRRGKESPLSHGARVTAGRAGGDPQVPPPALPAVTHQHLKLQPTELSPFFFFFAGE